MHHMDSNALAQIQAGRRPIYVYQDADGTYRVMVDAGATRRDRSLLLRRVRSGIPEYFEAIEEAVAEARRQFAHQAVRTPTPDEYNTDPCPTCGAAPGEDCRTKSGQPAHHQSRPRPALDAIDDEHRRIQQTAR